MILAGAALAAALTAAPGEVLIDGGSAETAPQDGGRRVHGEARLGVSFGLMQEDPFATLHPSLAFDLADILPLRFRLGAPVRLRLFDRPQQNDGVVRGRDFNEVGDFLAILEQFSYRDELVFRTYGRVRFDARIGELGRVTVGHGSLVRGFSNSLDMDRRRSGLDLWTRIEGRLLDQVAGVEASLLATDLAGSQLLGGRLGLDWAGAAVGFTGIVDPTAPRAVTVGMPDTTVYVLDDRTSLVADGKRGVAALGVDLAYRATDDWRYFVTPYVDLNLMPNLGKGMHIGVDGEFVVDRKRKVRLGAFAELTVGDRNYDPVYFDVFYLSQRWQVPFVGLPGDRPSDLTDEAAPKYQFVQDVDLGTVGGSGGLRFAHAKGAFAEATYQWRPGPLGGTFELRSGISLAQIDLVALYAHRGRHGFEVHHLPGTVTQLSIRVPVIRYVDLFGAGGYLFAMRRDPPSMMASAQASGMMSGGGFFTLGVGGRVPW